MKRLIKKSEKVISVNELIKKIRLEKNYESITNDVDIDYNKEQTKKDEITQIIYCDYILNKQKIENEYDITITEELWKELINTINQATDTDIIIPEGIWLEIYDDNIMRYDEILNEETTNRIKSSDNNSIKIEYYHKQIDYRQPRWNDEEDNDEE